MLANQTSGQSLQLDSYPESWLAVFYTEFRRTGRCKLRTQHCTRSYGQPVIGQQSNHGPLAHSLELDVNQRHFLFDKNIAASDIIYDLHVANHSHAHSRLVPAILSSQYHNNRFVITIPVFVNSSSTYHEQHRCDGDIATTSLLWAC